MMTVEEKCKSHELLYLGIVSTCSSSDTFLSLYTWQRRHEQRDWRLDSWTCWQWWWCTIGWRRRWYWRIWTRLVQRWGRSAPVTSLSPCNTCHSISLFPWISLLALPEVERERILSERSEERQRNLERLEVRKLLNDGRREDTTRRKYHTCHIRFLLDWRFVLGSTRAKGSGTSRALNELTRRREEKHKSRSKRGRRSPTPERKRTRYSDESAGEASEIEEEDEYYAETKVNHDPLISMIID